MTAGDEALAAEAREWIADCPWADLDEEGAAGLSDSEALAGVERHFVGGLDEFRRYGSGVTG